MNSINAKIKSIGSKGRVKVPAQFATCFDKSKAINVMLNTDNSIRLTQRVTKSQKKNIISQFMPYTNGSVQFVVSRYFEPNLDKVVIYNEKDSVVIYGLD